MHFHRNLNLTNVRVIGTLAFLILMLAWPLPARAAVQLELLSPPQVNAAPRRMLTISIRVTNDATDPETYQVAADVPPGWQYTAMPEILEIGGGESEVVFISVDPPTGGDPGEYDIVLNAYPEGVSSEAVSVEMTVRVLATMLLDVQPGRSYQPAVFSNDEIEQTFIVTNLGNAPTMVAIETESRQDWPLTVDPPDRRLELEPLQSATVTVTTSIPEELTQSISYRLSVIARSLEPGYEEVEGQTSTSTRVIPSRLFGGPIYATLDSDIETLIAWRDDDDIASSLSLGTLELEISEGRSVSLGPLNFPITGSSIGGFGRSHMISARYEDMDLGYIHAGDFSISMGSRLMGGSKSGRGGEALYRNGDGEYRIFYTRGRGSIPDVTTGLEVGYDFSETVSVILTAFTDSELSVPEGYTREPESSTNLGILVGYQPSEDMEVTGELARSSGSESGSDNAWRLNANYKLDRFSTSCEWLWAGADFRGGWRDTEIKRLNLSFSILDNVNIWGNYNQSRNNLADNPDEEGRRNRDMAFGATWNIENIGRLRVSHRTNSSKDVILDEHDQVSRTTEYSFSKSWSDFSLTASWQDQTEEDHITGDQETEDTLRLDGTARLNNDISLKFGYATGSTSQNNGEEAVHTTDLSLGSDIKLSKDMDLSLSIQKNSGGLQGSRTSINGALNWEMPSGCSLNLRARSHTGTFGGITEVVLGFTYPLSIPMKMFPRKGSAEGRLFLSDDPTQGIPNVEISVGRMTMVTDDNGFFRFPSLDPGEHQLTLDTPSLGVGLTPVVELPLVFIVTAGATVELEIPVMRSVTVGGQVFVETPGAKGEMPSRKPIANMVIELKSDAGSKYRYTDSFGRFLYTDLSPGSFVVLLRSEWLPQWHEVREPASYEFELASDDSRRDLEFIVIPTEREIEIKEF